MLSLIKSHLIHLSRFGAIIGLYTVLLLAITALIAAVPGSHSQTIAVANPSFNFILEDLDQSELSQRLTSHLESLYTRLDSPEDPAILEERLFTGEIHASIQIPENFEANFAREEQELFFDFAPNVISGYTVRNEINCFMALANIIAREKELLKQDPTWTRDDLSRLDNALSTRAEIVPHDDPKAQESTDNPGHKGIFRLMGYTYLVTILTICTGFANTYRNGSIQARSRIGKLSNFTQLTARITAEFILVIMTLTFMLGGSIILVHFLFGDVPAFLKLFPRMVPAALLIGLNGIAISHLLSRFTNEQTASPAVTVLSLGMAFISGAFVPTHLLSPLPLTLARFFPLYYYIDIVDASSPRALDYWAHYSILSLMAAILFALNLFIQRYKPRTNLMSVETDI